jgi:hypothetical protein
MTLLKQIKIIHKGYSEVLYLNKKYGITKSKFNNGCSYKIYAEELGGNDFISLNNYITSKEEILKPCEMPKQKVIHFLNNIKLQ